MKAALETTKAISVSIIVPCYNQAKYLADALDSVLAQTCTKWECIVVNDGSTDNTEEVAKAYCTLDDRFQYLAKKNEGVAAARNEGISVAKGYYILPLDADDKIGVNYLDLALTAFKKNPSLKVVYCKAELFGAESGPWELAEPEISSLLIDNMIFTSALFKKKDFERAGEYNTSLVYGLEDWDFWLKLLKNDYEIYRINSVQFYYRKNEYSRSSTVAEDEQKAMLTRADIFYSNLDLYLEKFGDPIKIFKRNLKLQKELTLFKKSRTYRILSFIKGIKNLVKKKEVNV